MTTKKTGTMGVQWFVPYGIYAGSGFYSSHQGQNMKTTAKDLALFDEAMIHASSSFKTTSKSWIQIVFYARILLKKGTGSNFRDYVRHLQAEVTSNHLPVSDRDVLLLFNDFVDRLDKDKDIHEVRFHIPTYAHHVFGSLKELEDALVNLGAKHLLGEQGIMKQEDDHNYDCEYVWLMEVRHSNINGDPQADNMPRRFSETDIGFATQYRIKRWVRDYLEQMKGEQVFISSTVRGQKAEDRYKEVAKALNNESSDILFNFIDNRLFGILLPKSSEVLVGPVSIQPSISLHNIAIEDITVTSVFAGK
jgi:hypothetical protein